MLYVVVQIQPAHDSQPKEKRMSFVGLALAIAGVVVLLTYVLLFRTNRHTRGFQDAEEFPRKGESTEEEEGSLSSCRRKAPKHGLYYTDYGGQRRA